jgi:PHS family inorganic phosphate transporter-like MFS transporter
MVQPSGVQTGAEATPEGRAQRRVHPALFAFATGVGLLTDKYILGATNFVAWSFGKPVGFQADIDKAASLIFAVVGMIVFGPLSDLLGRRTCMLLTSAITVIGAIGSACALNEWMLIGFRMLTGLGMGGEYPLASTHTAKNSDKGQASRNVALLYLFGSGFGQALCPTVVWFTLGCGATDEFTWRFMFAFAAFLASLGLVLRFLTTSNDEMHEGEAPTRERRIQPEKLRVFWRPLLGAAVGWFMYDLVEYGLKSNDTEIFGGNAATHLAQARAVALNRYTQVPFLALAAYALACINTKTSQCIGFLGCGAVCLVLAIDFQALHDQGGPLFFVLYMLQLAFQAFCGTTTLAIPSQVFPSSFVGSGAGIAAATGKIGATVGTYLFSAWGDAWARIFATCVGTCALGLLVTIVAVPGYNAEKLRVMEKLAAKGDEAAAVRSLYAPLSQVTASDCSHRSLV